MNVLTPTTMAKRLAVQPSKVYEYIENGSLEAVDVSARADRRPRWRISEAAYKDFVRARSSSVTVSSP